MKIEKRDFNIKPSSINHEERTVEVVWTSGAKVERRGYIEELVVNSESVDLSSLNAGVNLIAEAATYKMLSALWIQHGLKMVRVMPLFAFQSVQRKYGKMLKKALSSISVGY